LPSYLNELNNFILWLNLPPDVDWRQYGNSPYLNIFSYLLKSSNDFKYENLSKYKVGLQCHTFLGKILKWNFY